MAEAFLAEVRRRCMALPEVTEGLTHGGPTWFVRGRRSFVKFVDPAEHPQLDLPHIAIWAAACQRPPYVSRTLLARNNSVRVRPAPGSRCCRWRCASASRCA